MFKKHFSGQSGQVVVIVAILIISLFGMAAYVVDVGVIYETRRHLQTTADAAALAGAQNLPESSDTAVAKAIEYAASHNVVMTEDDVVISASGSLPDTIKVTPSIPDIKLYFAPILGHNTANVGATATARVYTPTGTADLVPFGALVPEGEDPYNYFVGGQEYIVKFGGGHGENGNFYAMDLDGFQGGGAHDYEDRIRDGYQEYLEVGDIIATETGNMSNPTKRGVDDRVGSTWYSFDDLTDIDAQGNYSLKTPKTGQFVMVPVIYELINPHGWEEIEIIAFAPFIITRTTGQGNNSIVYCKFIDKALIVTEGGVTTVEPTGLRVIRLVE